MKVQFNLDKTTKWRQQNRQHGTHEFMSKWNKRGKKIHEMKNEHTKKINISKAWSWEKKKRQAAAISYEEFITNAHFTHWMQWRLNQLTFAVRLNGRVVSLCDGGERIENTWCTDIGKSAASLFLHCTCSTLHGCFFLRFRLNSWCGKDSSFTFTIAFSLFPFIICFFFFLQMFT